MQIFPALLAVAGLTISVAAMLVPSTSGSLTQAPASSSATPPSSPSTPMPASSSATADSVANAARGPRLYSKSGYDITPWSRAQVLEAAKSLPEDVQKVVLLAGTEPPFCGAFTDTKEEGIYVCVVGGLPLFKSEHKFISKSGWASFHTPFDPAHIIEKVDRSHGMVRTEILCARSGAHLGHVFDDGPPPTGRRYCLNSAALAFIPKGKELPPESRPVTTEVAYFGGGCFWGVEDAFAKIPGVIDAESGFAGGASPTVTYKEVCYGNTGHAEVVKITFDPAAVSYRDLVKQFFRIHDPTTLNRQGPDIGDQYRSAIFTVSDEQARTAKEIIGKLSEIPAFQRVPIVTKVEPVKNYVKAEEYHQDYHKKNGGHCHMRGYSGPMDF